MKYIIVVDMQKGFINKNNIHLIDKIINYLKSNQFDCIFYTIFKNVRNSPFQKTLNYNGRINKNEQELVVNILLNSIML